MTYIVNENCIACKYTDCVEFYTFTWGRKPKPRPQGGKRQNGDQPRKKQGGKPKGKPNRGDQGKARSFEAKPKKEKQIDPDNPFAVALMGLKK